MVLIGDSITLEIGGLKGRGSNSELIIVFKYILLNARQMFHSQQLSKFETIFTSTLKSPPLIADQCSFVATFKIRTIFTSTLESQPLIADQCSFVATFKIRTIFTSTLESQPLIADQCLFVATFKIRTIFTSTLESQPLIADQRSLPADYIRELYYRGLVNNRYISSLTSGATKFAV